MAMILEYVGVKFLSSMIILYLAKNTKPTAKSIKTGQPEAQTTNTIHLNKYNSILKIIRTFVVLRPVY